MGQQYVNELKDNPRWNIKYLCDRDEDQLAEVHKTVPIAKAIQDPNIIFEDQSIDVVGIFAYADSRYGFIKKALAVNKDILAEKPLGVNNENEMELLELIDNSGKLVAVNLFNRNAWYHKEIIEFVKSGEIGDLAIIRISHQTPGRMPYESNHLVSNIEGAPFHCCGMHYLDLTRWYAESEISNWHAQGIKMWGWQEPWWMEVHGSMENGMVFNITNGFTYGQMAETWTVNSSVELQGTLGVVRMHHNFKDVFIDYHGTSKTLSKKGLYGGKKIDVMIDVFTKSLDQGKNLGFPSAKDSIISSCLTRDMLEAATNDPNTPSIGKKEDIKRILEFKMEKWKSRH